MIKLATVELVLSKYPSVLVCISCATFSLCYVNYESHRLVLH